MKRRALIFGAAMLAMLSAAAGVLAATGDFWNSFQPDAAITGGTLIYESQGNRFVYDDATLSFHLAKDATRYTVEAQGRYMYDNSHGLDFAFIGSSATLKDDNGTILCTGGKLNAGGSFGGSWIVEMKFKKNCVLPGEQYVTIDRGTGWVRMVER